MLFFSKFVSSSVWVFLRRSHSSPAINYLKSTWTRPNIVRPNNNNGWLFATWINVPHLSPFCFSGYIGYWGLFLCECVACFWRKKVILKATLTSSRTKAFVCASAPNHASLHTYENNYIHGFSASWLSARIGVNWVLQ
jgi:hypothetical protein